MKFETASGSLYEVDDINKKIRRLIGIKDPTPRQGIDGQWRGYKELALELGQSAVIFWDPETTPLLEDNPFVSGSPATITSTVTNIIVGDGPYRD